jgi:beta-glucanase (GH16 family)
MRAGTWASVTSTKLTAILLSGLLLLLCACGGSSSSSTPPPPPPTAAPTVTTTNALGGAVIVSLASTTNGAAIYYTVDGSKPTTSSPKYIAPFLVASNLTLNAIAVVGSNDSTVTSQTFSPNIASGTLVWSDEFSNTTGAPAEPNPQVWTYDTGTDCCGNNELETYCAWGDTTDPGCSTTNPSAYVGTGGNLYIVAQEPQLSPPVYTSARLKTEGLFSFQYGRLEVYAQVPEAQGFWPAIWLLGDNITTLSWPACGELDVMEHIDGNDPPPYVGGAPPGYDWIAGSVHGGTSSSEISGSQTYHPSGFSAADWHAYGMIWSKGQVEYYVDNPSNIYATFTPTNGSFNTSTWPFDQGPQFIILNLAIGGDWPGPPDATTPFPSLMVVQYVRVYTN